MSKRWLPFAKQHMLPLIWMGMLMVFAVFGHMITNADPYLVRTEARFAPPSWHHPFGTDGYGRDVFARIVAGTRISWVVVLFTSLITLLLGLALGLAAGYLGGIWDLILSRVSDVFQSFPSILLGAMFAAALGPSLKSAILSVGIFGTPIMARVVRGSVLQIKEALFVEAARAVGASGLHIVLKHILRNVLGTIVIQLTSQAPRAVISTAGLSFLGLGAQPPIPEWGAMIAEARQSMYLCPQYLLVTASVLAVTSLSMNLLGDGLRDYLMER